MYAEEIDYTAVVEFPYSLVVDFLYSDLRRRAEPTHGWALPNVNTPAPAVFFAF